MGKMTHIRGVQVPALPDNDHCFYPSLCSRRGRNTHIPVCEEKRMVVALDAPFNPTRLLHDFYVAMKDATGVKYSYQLEIGQAHMEVLVECLWQYAKASGNEKIQDHYDFLSAWLINVGMLANEHTPLMRPEEAEPEPEPAPADPNAPE